MLTLLLLAVFIMTVVLLGALGGLWDNFLMFVNILLAGLIATNFFEPAAAWLDSVLGPDYNWYTDMLAFWGLFALAVGLLRTFTDLISTVRVKFKMPVETGGSIALAVLCGWLMVCLTAFSLHLAPLEVNSWGGEFQAKPESVNFFGLGPDLLWLSFAHKMSHPDYGPLAVDERHVFDERGLYRVKYGLRRYRFEQLNASKGKSPVE
jgi:hypothetical protein